MCPALISSKNGKMEHKQLATNLDESFPLFPFFRFLEAIKLKLIW